MSQLSHIKQRIHAVQKTQKITRAMRLIAMSLYSKLERQKATLSEYDKAVGELTTLLKQHTSTIPSIFMPEELNNTRPLIILCSSTKGLCGGMNSNIVRYFEKTFMLEKQQQANFIAIGSRAHSFLKERNPGPVVYAAPEATIPMIPTIATKILSLICEQQENPYSSVMVYHTHLKNFFLQTPMKEALIPLDLNNDTNPVAGQETTETPRQYIWEQEPAVLGAHIARQYIHTRLVHMLFDNLISENAARFIAMDQSTNNAEKYLETLSMQYNKSRQSLITREIAELSSNMDEI